MSSPSMETLFPRDSFPYVYTSFFRFDGRQFLFSLWEFLPGVAVVLSAILSVPVTITGSVLSAYDYFFPLYFTK